MTGNLCGVFPFKNGFPKMNDLKFVALHEFPKAKCNAESRDSSVGIAIRLWAGRSVYRDDRSSIPGRGWEFFCSPPGPDGLWTHPASYPMGIGGSYTGLKRPGSEADHSPPSRAEVKNTWSYNSTPPYTFTEWCLVKHRDEITFTFTFKCDVLTVAMCWNIRTLFCRER
jgi:hypothetical protein